MEAISALFMPMTIGIVIWLLMWLIGQIVVGGIVGIFGGNDDEW